MPREKTLLAIVLLIAAAVRMPRLLFDGLWRDQANLFVQATSPTFSEFFSRTVASEWHPPLYPLISLAIVRAFGTAETSFTLVPYLMSLACVIAVYALGSFFHDRKTGVLAAAFLALSPSATSTSVDYLYPQFVLLVTVLAAIAIRVGRRPVGVRMWLMIAVVTMLTAYTHYAALIVVPPLAIYAIAFARDARARITISTAFVAGLGTFAAWLPIFAQQRTIGLPYVVPTTPMLVFVTFANDVFSMLPGFQKYVQIGFVVALAVVIRFGFERSDRANRWLALGGIVIVGSAGLAVLNLRETRYAVELSGIADVFFAYAFVRAFEKRAWPASAQWVATVLVMGVVILDIRSQIASVHVPRSGIATFASEVGFRRDTLYVVAPSYLGASVAFYARGDVIALRGFVQYDRPDIFRLGKSIELWRDPAIVPKIATRIDRDALRFKYLALVRETIATDSARMPYGKVDSLQRALEARHRLVACLRFPGRLEDVTVCRYEAALKK